MADQTYIKIPSIYNKLKAAEEDNRTIYISGAVGWGKTAAVRYYYRRKAYLYISGEEGYLKEQPEAGGIRQHVIVIDDISWITDEASQDYICALAKNQEKQLVLIGRSGLPSWLRTTAAELQFVMADERDLRFTVKEIGQLFDSRGLTVPEAEQTAIYQDSNGHALSLCYVAYHISGGYPYTPDITEAVIQDLFHYYDHAFYDKWDNELREVLIAVCQYSEFTIEMAEMLTGNRRIPGLIEYAISIGSFIIRKSENVYAYRKALRYYLCWKQNITWTKEQISQNYERAALYYELHDMIRPALKCYEYVGDQEKISRLLIKNAQKHPGNGCYFEVREYYYGLPEDMVRISPVLMSGMSMLYSLMLQPEESDRWYHELELFEKNANNESQLKKEAEIRLAYLMIALPHKGVHGFIKTLKNIAVLCMNKHIKLPEFSVTGNQPSLMNGGLDFSEWSRNDKELSVLLKKPIELVLGKFNAGLINIALAESGFEKGTMEIYEVMTRLNSGYMMADSGGKIEMCYVAEGLLAKVHLSQGQIKIAENGLQRFYNKVSHAKAEHLLSNIETMNVWIMLLQGKTADFERWLEDEAPDESIGFFVMDRYGYMQKIRCLIALKRYTEAISLVERMNLYFTEYKRHYHWMELQVLKAILQYRIGNSEWQETLNGTLRMMERYHFIRIIGWEGAAIKPLLDTLHAPEISADFFKLLMGEAARLARYYPDYLGEEKQLTEPLTDMERQILKLLCEEWTSQQICGFCGFTYSTLKFHNRNIYHKLGAKNRKEAEITARRLGLCD